MESISVFVMLLKGQTQWKVFRITEMLINREFKLLGTKLDLILESLKDAIKVLNASIR
jgi:hypothetical protein